jgi:uroporphyrinogen III methyltransferase/synthase
VTVYLVGAGPGDPGLLTVRGRDLLVQAEVVVYDRLSVATLLDLAPAGAERINVGKFPGHPTMPQAEIDALLVERGRAGQFVVRLKGGDPFVFARGGEEASALQAAGVPFEIVPGISSSVAVPAYAGIPLTMRHSSELFTVITGHEDPDKGGELDWGTVAKLGGTIVVLMGIARLAKIVGRLLDGGLASSTPLAVVRWGTRPEQRTLRTTLGGVLDHVDELASPSVIVIGKVAAMDLSWYEQRPLFGHRVIVTRARAQASTLVDALRESGAETIELPMIEIVDPDDGGAALRAAAGRVREHAWVVLTSANGAGRFLACLRDARSLGDVKVAAIGPGTADVLRSRGIVADLEPPRSVGEALVEAFPAPDPASRPSVLVASAAGARDVVPQGLAAKGWDVEVVDAYRTRPVPVTDADRRAVADATWVTFTSASTVEHFVDAFGASAAPANVACIGPVTSAAARAHGIEVTVEGRPHTVPGIVAALVEHVADVRGNGGVDGANGP